MKTDVSQVVTARLCHACGACATVCPLNIISYVESVGGNVVPEIDSHICNRCGLCYQVCPGVGLGETLAKLTPSDPFIGEILSCEVGRATDEAVFANGQSGGVLTALLSYLFNTGRIEAALVAIMPIASPPRGDVMVATSSADLIQTQKSKYSPIPLLQALRDLCKLKGQIAVVGPACRFHGLHNLLDLVPELLHRTPIKLGLVCDRMMSTAAIDYLGRQAANVPINHIVWRDKRRPSYPGNPVVSINGAGDVVLRASQRMAIKDFFTPVRCRLCPDKLNVFSDIVFGDPHGIKDVDRVGGETLVLVRTEIGKEILSLAKKSGAMLLRKTSIEAALAGQGAVKNKAEWSGYMKAWKEMGHLQPNYPFATTDTTNKTSKYHKLLKQGLALDKFRKREELLETADAWLLKQKIKKCILLPLAKTKGIWEELRTGRKC